MSKKLTVFKLYSMVMANTIKQFKSIPNKKASSFVNFDVENFYSSMSEKLLTDAVSYAKDRYNGRRTFNYNAFKVDTSLPKLQTVGEKKTVTRTLMFPWDVTMEWRFVSL